MTGVVVAEKTKSLGWSPGWFSASIAFGTSLLVLGAVFWSSYSDIVSIWWRSETYAHGFLILPIVAYLIWEKRAELARVSPQPAPRATLLMVFPALLWLLGYAAQLAVVEQLAVVTMLPVFVWVIFGNDVVRKIMFPLAYLFFAVPVGDFLVLPLQDITAVFSVWALQLTGIPVYWEGLFFHIPSGSFEVAEACSGIRYLIASLALGTLYAYLNYTSLKRRLIFIVMAAIVPIIANGIRAYGIVMIAHLSDYSLAVGVDHIIYGWIFFGVVIFLLFWVGSFFREKAVSVPGKETVSADIVAVNGKAPTILTFVMWAVLATGVAISASGFAAWMDARSAEALATDVKLPLGHEEWSGPFETDTQWSPSVVGAQEHRVEYRKDGESVQVYLAYYPSQNKDAELINWNNVVFDDKQSRRLGGGVTQARLSAKRSWPVLVTRLESEGRTRLVWHWYEIDGSATVSRVWAKAYAARSRLLGTRSGSAAWVISAEYSMGAEEAAVVMEDFLTTMLPQLRGAVNQ